MILPEDFLSRSVEEVNVVHPIFVGQGIPQTQARFPPQHEIVSFYNHVDEEFCQGYGLNVMQRVNLQKILEG